MELMKALDEMSLSAADWRETPVAVQKLVKVLWAENQELKKRLNLVEEQIKKNSKNSSRPPSTDGLEKKKSEKSNEVKRKRGGQKGHKGHERHLYESSVCEEIYVHQPEVCKDCGTELKGLDEKPYRHQVVEISCSSSKLHIGKGLKPLVTKLSKKSLCNLNARQLTAIDTEGYRASTA